MNMESFRRGGKKRIFAGMAAFVLVFAGGGYAVFCLAASCDKARRAAYFKEVFQVPRAELKDCPHEWDPDGRYLIVGGVSAKQFADLKDNLRAQGFVSWQTRLAERGFLLAAGDKDLLKIDEAPHRVTYSEYPDRKRGGFSNMVLYDHLMRTLHFVFVTDFGG